MNRFCLTGLTLVFVFWVSLIQAQPRLTMATEQFESNYQSLNQKKQELEAKIYGNIKRYALAPHLRQQLPLRPHERALAVAYVKVLDEWKTLHRVRQFRDDMVTKYETHTGLSAADGVRIEATRIALHLFAKTEQLREEFNMSPMPLWQNTLVNLKIRERGFCYHWATDLLDSLKPLPRTYFQVTWAESRPDTPREHNVTVIFPKGDEFQNGLLFDPWRKGGKPYWRTPKTDTRFLWKKWDGYGIH